MPQEARLLKVGQKRLLSGVAKLTFSDFLDINILHFLSPHPRPQKKRNVMGGPMGELLMKTKANIPFLLKRFEIQFFTDMFFYF